MRSRLRGSALSVASLAIALGACGGTAGPPGSSCTIRDDDGGTGATITCGDGTTVHLSHGSNGTNGRNGTNGTNGASGANGTNGADGLPCTVVANDAGTSTITCADGTTVTVRNGQNANCTVTTADGGAITVSCSDGSTSTVHNGTNGANGTNGGNVEVRNFHGGSYLMSSGEYAMGAKVLVDATITSADADTAGVVTVNFRVLNRDTPRTPVTTLGAVSANIMRLQPETATTPSNWIPYIWQTETVTTTGAWPAPVGTTALQAYRESSGTGPTNGTLTNNGDGTYRYVFRTNLTSAMRGATPIAFERNRTHRVAIMFGGHSGPTADAWFDFVPDGSAVTDTRNLISTSTCQSCHGANEFHGHGGDRLHLEVCATCHVDDAFDAHSGHSLGLRVMIHKIHAGGELASVRGPDGIRYDDPGTTANEALDNGDYSIWGYRTTRLNWGHVEFPAILSNCTKCHEGTGAQVNNWRQRPSRAACGSCHDDVSFAAGTTSHAGGEQADDTSCSSCHPATGSISGVRAPVTAVHDWLGRDPRNTAEFDATITVSSPANGTHFVAGESPVLTVVLRDHVTGTAIDHTTVAEDPAAEACPTPYSATTCVARDGLFRDGALMVHGPRSLRVPVLTTAARAQLFSAGSGPFDLSAPGASLIVQFDRGREVRSTDASGGDTTLAGTVTVTVSSAPAGTFPTPAGATTDQIVTWLNANAAFRARGIAWNEGGRVGIRSRNRGDVFGIQLQSSAVATAVFGGNLTLQAPGGYYQKNDLRSRINPANNDPKVSWTTGAITYRLDPVDDLQPGTYVAFVEFADRGTTSSGYWATTVARATFQVGTATAQLPPAGNCNSCHQASDGRGRSMSLTSVHIVPFEANAIDWCANCHDYLPGDVTSAAWVGAIPISRRVHAVHSAERGLYYPNATVGHADVVPGRNWQLPYPQDTRNCETCHPAGTTSGTWTMANRVACGGCHDSEEATAHLRTMTYDPTPTTPYSGDELEACRTCHGR